MEIVQETDSIIHAKYENCIIHMKFSDFLGIRTRYEHFQFDDTQIIYLRSFVCNMQPGKKGNGRILLSLLLEYIKNTRFKTEDIFVSLLASGNNRIDENGIEIQSDDTKLKQYYTKLGFRLISKDIDIMIGRLSVILSKCKNYNAGRISRNKRKLRLKKRSINNRYI